MHTYNSLEIHRWQFTGGKSAQNDEKVKQIQRSTSCIYGVNGYRLSQSKPQEFRWSYVYVFLKALSKLSQKGKYRAYMAVW